MRLFMSVIVLVAFLLGCVQQKAGIRRIVILESGVNINSKIKPFLCKDGHRAYIGERWDRDDTGHGTAVAELIAEQLEDPSQHCIMVYKTTRGDKAKPSQNAHAYATALHELTSRGGFDVLLVALEDTSYYYAEVGYYSKISTFADVVVAAGNSNKRLSKTSCEVYPACLKLQLREDAGFHIVGARGRFNQAPFITAHRNPSHRGTAGTSYSAARWAGELLSTK